ncbi:uncharacterized protein LOC143291091 isoform X2 [Babylonia areolata]|uniref:uncharacterized protein LOC143291091 isoform X2 n=1 Tax=Babylonia areolata TaxID=304850 RepID=UPI003FD42866
MPHLHGPVPRAAAPSLRPCVLPCVSAGHADSQVKTVHTSERESSPPTAATSTTTTTTTSAEPFRSLSLPPTGSGGEQAESIPLSFLGPAVSLSDDSWIFVSPEGRHRAGRPLTPALAASRHLHRRGDDDSWLLPSGGASHGAFPVVDLGQDVRGSASTDVTYRTLPGGEVEPVVTVSGRYDNVGPETFQRYAVDEPSVQLVRLPSKPPPLASPSSESSSETDTSDERGDEGSEDVTGSGSDVGSHGRNRRSRLSRFFRSLVMSDTDSFDEDDHVYLGPRVNGGERPPPPYHPGCGDFRQGSELVMASAHPGMEDRGGEVPTAATLPDASYFDHGAVSAGQQCAEPHSRSAAAFLEAGRGGDEREEEGQQCDSNHNSEVRGGQRNAAAIRADIAAHAHRAAVTVPGGAVGGVGVGGRAAASGVRPRLAMEVSDDSDEEYEPQTSMLRPKRKPRSRLKKFFTSLLSLSSSDEEEEDLGEGQVSAAPSTSNSERQ